jgi:catechol 2,3-dioxygenase-like lactoylglutathione lyase family enzyme
MTKTLPLAILLALPLCAQPALPPRILGISHVAFLTGNAERAAAFYKEQGFGDPLPVRKKDGSEPSLLVHIAPKQYLELSLQKGRKGELDHIAFQVDNIEAMHRYLTARAIPTSMPAPDNAGNPTLSFRDPDGRRIEMLQYGAKNVLAGRALPATRLSRHLTHVGVPSSGSPAVTKFYIQILGFRDAGNGLLKVSDGEDAIELLAEGAKPHVALEVAAGKSGALTDPDGTSLELAGPK